MNISFGTNIMPRIKVRRQKFGFGSLLVMLLLGAGFIAIGFFTVKASKIDPGWTKVTGTIVGSSTNTGSSSTTYAAVVQYQADGQSYETTSSTSSSSYPHIGDPRPVAYDPQHPDHAKVIDNPWFLYIFPVVGVIMVGIGPFAYVRSVRRSSDINHLVHDGQKLQGVIVGVQMPGMQAASNSSSNANSGFKITVEATDHNGQVQNYVSDSLDGIGALAMADFRAHPIPVDVYVNPSDPKDYYVDVTDIPSLTPDRIAELIKSAAGQSGNQPNQVAN